MRQEIITAMFLVFAALPESEKENQRKGNSRDISSKRIKCSGIQIAPLEGMNKEWRLLDWTDLGQGHGLSKSTKRDILHTPPQGL